MLSIKQVRCNAPAAITLPTSKGNHDRVTISEKNVGGADRDRTGDPLVANQVLSQLSYSPIKLVGLGRIELPTSPLSGVRSSQLSYRPGCTAGAQTEMFSSERGFEDRVERATGLRPI